MLYPLSELVIPVLELYVRLSQFLSERSNLKFVAFFGNAPWKFLRNQSPFLVFPVLDRIARVALPPVTACESVFRFWQQTKFARGLQMTSAVFFPTQQSFTELIRDETLQRLHLITQVAARNADFADLLLSSMCEILVKDDPGERFWDLFVVFLFICDQLPLFVTKRHIDVVLSPPLFHPDVTVSDNCEYFVQLNSLRSYAISAAVRGNYGPVALLRWVQYPDLFIEIVHRLIGHCQYFVLDESGSSAYSKALMTASLY
jgi:hypothetical protein